MTAKEGGRFKDFCNTYFSRVMTPVWCRLALSPEWIVCMSEVQYDLNKETKG